MQECRRNSHQGRSRPVVGLTDYLGIGRLIWEHALGSYVMQRTQKCLAAAPPGYIGEYPEQRDLIRAPQWVD